MMIQDHKNVSAFCVELSTDPKLTNQYPGYSHFSTKGEGEGSRKKVWFLACSVSVCLDSRTI